jgi:hypothetical protein
MNKAEMKDIREKIVKGLSLTAKRLVEQKKKNDENLVLWQDGRIVVVKARDISTKNV